jgi:hypothetical protein
VLVAGYLGYGALAATHEIPLGVAVASTAVIWALPGQIVFVEMHTLAAPLLATIVAGMLSSGRFLPMMLMLPGRAAAIAVRLDHGRGALPWHSPPAASLVALRFHLGPDCGCRRIDRCRPPWRRPLAAARGSR